MSKIEQLNGDMQKKISYILSQQMEVPFEFFITVTKVECAPSLKTARVFLSILPFNKAKQGMAWVINRRKQIQSFIAKDNRRKFTPILHFEHDDTEQTADEVYHIIDQL